MVTKFELLLVTAAFVCSVTGQQGLCVCNRRLRPVCGADGVTYGNMCTMTCKGIELRHPGECPSDPIRRCSCPAEHNPICGSDGVTYFSECDFNCGKSASNPNLSVAHPGACNPQPPCICTDDYTPVCGSDGKTYSNACALNCASAMNSSLRIVGQGAC